MDLDVALAILAVTLSAFLTRSGPLLLDAQLQLPPVIESALRYAPACALAALIAPDLLSMGAETVVWTNPSKLFAGGAAAAIFALSRSMIGAIVGGMAVFWITRALLWG